MLDPFQANETSLDNQTAALVAAVVGAAQAEMLLDPFYAQLRDQLRFWVQRVAVPCLTLVGLFGNAITIIIMTRRRMRSTTNMYLAALAFVDMLYLVLTFLLGLSHYPNVTKRTWYAYWRTRPFLMMLTDACSNTSVWLTVTFTIERFIAVKYPIKGKVWCTEARAKRLIVCVFVFGILFASPVPFEWEVKEREPKGGVAAPAVPSAQGQSTNTAIAVTSDQLDLGQQVAAGSLLTSGGDLSVDNDALNLSEGDPGRDWGRLTDDGEYVWGDLYKSPNSSKTSESIIVTPTEIPPAAHESTQPVVDIKECTLSLEYTEFGANETYKTIYYWSTAVIFCFVPLILLTLFNGFLIRSVHSSRRKRNLMTNTQAGGQHQQQQQAAACKLQRARSLRDQLGGKLADKQLGRARLLIKKRNCNSTAANEPPPPTPPLPSKVMICSSSPPNLTVGTNDKPMTSQQQHASGLMRNSIIKLPPPDVIGARCSSCAKVTFRQIGNSAAAPALEFSGSDARAMIVNESDIERRGGTTTQTAGALRHVDFTSTCDTDAADNNQLATNNSPYVDEARRVGAAREQVADTNALGAHQSGACPPLAVSGQCDYTVEGERHLATERLDDMRDNKSTKIGGSSIENFKSTLARSKSAIGGGGANGRSGDNNHFRSHQLSLKFGNAAGGRKRAGAGMSNDASPLSIASDNGACTTIALPPSAPPPPPPAHAVASSQERRITIMLIAVVILFLVCQIPSAGMLLYTSVREIKSQTNEEALVLAFGNIFNFLMAVNAAGNFILYSFLSKKYRNTFVATFCKCTWGRDSARARTAQQPKSRGYSSSCDGQSTTSQGRASRGTPSTNQHLVSSYQSTTTTTTTTSGGGANSSASSDETTRCSTPASLVRFCRRVRFKAKGESGGVCTKVGMQPLTKSAQLANGRPNLL